jgi:hypothetical protein
MTDLCSGQAKGDADTDNDADRSNPFIPLFQGDTLKLLDNIYISHLVRGKAAIERNGKENWEIFHTMP